jgi:hypothetical protein
MIITSKNTSVNSKKVPAMFTKIDKYYGWKKGTINLDYGGGKYDTATEYLKTKRVKNCLYDPFARDLTHNLNALDKLYNGFEGNQVDTVTVSNVLCVVKEKVNREGILICTYAMLKVNGTIFISVYEGDKSGKGKLTKKDCWQNNRTLESYLPEVKKYFKNAHIEHRMIIATREE